MAKQICRYVERDGKIYARVSYTDSSGKRRQIWRRAESKSDAKEIAKKIERELDEFGSEVFEHQQTLDEYLDRWLATIKHAVSEKTYDDYESLLRRHVRPVLGKKILSKIKPLDLQGLIDRLRERGLSARTVRYTHTIVSSALKQAVKWRLLTHNPAQYVELPKIQQREMQSLSQETALKFLATLPQDKYGLLFELALITGMRPEEYLALKWSDINFTNGTVTVNRVLFRKREGGGWYFKEPKTKKSKRTIPLSSRLMQALSNHKRVQAKERLKAGPEWQDNDLVFASEIGTPLSLRNLERRHFKPLLRKAELPDIRLYDLRHSCATLLLAAGENPKVVSERLGHASIVLTLDIYSHVLPSMQKAATEKLEAVLSRKRRR